MRKITQARQTLTSQVKPAASRINTEVQLRVLSSTRLNMVTQFKFRPLTQAHYPPGTSGTDSGADNH